MQQIIHLLIVDADRCAALASWHGGRWLLPVAVIGERLRAGLVIPAWLAAQGYPGGRFIGQWLGRADASARAIDWLAIVRMEFGTLPVDAPMQPTSLSTLKGAPSVTPYQQWAACRVLSISELPSIPGPFGTLAWPSTVDAWVESFADGGRQASSDVIVHRATAHEVVLEYRTTRQRRFFKGLDGDRAVEARLVTQLSRIADRSFPATRAIAHRSNRSVWWLMEACGGTALATGPTIAAATRVARDFARVQQAVVKGIATGRVSALPELDLSRPLTQAAVLLDEVCERGVAADVVSVFEHACRRASARDVPRSWIPADFDPANVLIDDEGVRYIDLTDSTCGPAPIAIGTFVGRLRRGGLACGRDVWNAYARTWRPRAVRVRSLDFELASALVECHLDWQRVIRKTERGEIEGVLDAARRVLAARLIAAARPTARAGVI